jgi:hypothetical protein
MTTALRDHRGVLLVYFLDHDDTVKSYCGTTERLRQADNQKKARIAEPSIINSQDNTRPHNTNRTCDWFRRSALELGDYEHPSLQLQPPLR